MWQLFSALYILAGSPTLPESVVVQIINSLTGMLTVVLGITTAFLSYFTLRRSNKNSGKIDEVDHKVNGVLTASEKALGVEAGRQLARSEDRENKK